jgi:hypothetical protein
VATEFFGVTCHGVLSVESTANLEHNGQLGTSSADVWFFVGTTNITGPVAFNGGTSGTHQTVTFGQYVDTAYNANVTFNKSVQVGSAGTDLLNVTAGAGFHGTVTFNGSDFTWNGGSSGTHATINVGQYYDVVFNCSTAVSFSGSGGISNGGPLLQSGATTFSGPTSAGIQNITASGAAISAGAASVILKISGGGVAALPTSGMLSGQVIEIVNKQPSTNVNIQVSGATLFNLHHTGSNQPWVRMIYNVSVWEVFTFGDYAA